MSRDYLGSNRDIVFDVYVNGQECTVVIERHAAIRSIERFVCLDVLINDLKKIIAGINDIRKKKGEGYLKIGEAVVVYIPEYKVSAAALMFRSEFIVKTVVLNGINSGVMLASKSQKIFELGEDGIVREKNIEDYIIKDKTE